MMEPEEVFQSGLADLLGHPKAWTPHAVLLRQLFDSRIPKTEREHAAVREIEQLTAANERLKGLLREARDLAWSPSPDALHLLRNALKEPPR